MTVTVEVSAQWIKEEWRKAYLIKIVGGKFQLSEI